MGVYLSNRYDNIKKLTEEESISVPGRILVENIKIVKVVINMVLMIIMMITIIIVMMARMIVMMLMTHVLNLLCTCSM